MKSLKPLIMWARDQYPEPYKLRYTQRTPDYASGLLRIGDDWTPFRYDRSRRIIHLGAGENAREIHLNEWGWEQGHSTYILSK